MHFSSLFIIFGCLNEIIDAEVKNKELIRKNRNKKQRRNIDEKLVPALLLASIGKGNSKDYSIDPALLIPNTPKTNPFLWASTQQSTEIAIS